ncbi:MBL fold metallo-hydrolase, partial [Candidatus Poribacteria bacterium]|nr:MBL fold metallo-hydrolase [Candidatus Poribacteria bacterium]
KPLLFVVITHGHWDHDGGLDALAENGIIVLCNEKLRKRYEESEKKGSFIGIKDNLMLNNNKRVINFFTSGTVHSDNDLFTFLPDEKVIFTGDAVVNAHSPWMGESDVQNWIKTLRMLAGMEVDTVCVGHGPLAGHEVFAQLSRYLTALRDEVGYRVSQGRSLKATLDQVNIPLRKEWLVDDNAFSDHIKSVYSQLTSEVPPSDTSLMPKALVLIGDNYHPPHYIPPSLEPVFQRIGMPVKFFYDVSKLNAKSLEGIKLFVILRDGMIWPEPDGKQVFWMTEEQEKAIAEFVKNGGGLLALHNSTALKCLDEKACIYRDMLGCSYNGHGPGDEKFDVKVVNKDHPVTRGVEDYVAVDERHTPIMHTDDATILLEAVSDNEKSVNGFVRNYGKGRICHLANGHNLEVLQNPNMQKLMTNAALWCCGMEMP